MTVMTRAAYTAYAMIVRVPSHIDGPLSGPQADKIAAGVVAMRPELAPRYGAIREAFRRAARRDRQSPLPISEDASKIASRVHALWYHFAVLACRTSEGATLDGRTGFRIYDRSLWRVRGCGVWRWEIKSAQGVADWWCECGEAASREAARRQMQDAARRLRERSRLEMPRADAERTAGWRLVWDW